MCGCHSWETLWCTFVRFCKRFIRKGSLPWRNLLFWWPWWNSKLHRLHSSEGAQISSHIAQGRCLLFKIINTVTHLQWHWSLWLAGYQRLNSVSHKSEVFSKKEEKQILWKGPDYSPLFLELSPGPMTHPLQNLLIRKATVKMQPFLYMSESLL